jgi:hypothetical protein
MKIEVVNNVVVSYIKVVNTSLSTENCSRSLFGQLRSIQAWFIIFFCRSHKINVSNKGDHKDTHLDINRVKRDHVFGAQKILNRKWAADRLRGEEDGRLFDMKRGIFMSKDNLSIFI